ncbi:MAG: hypothetical protein Q9162_002541 [Coniocarpon cinnabarinum]
MSGDNMSPEPAPGTSRRNPYFMDEDESPEPQRHDGVQTLTQEQESSQGHQQAKPVSGGEPKSTPFKQSQAAYPVVIVGSDSDSDSPSLPGRHASGAIVIDSDDDESPVASVSIHFFFHLCCTEYLQPQKILSPPTGTPKSTPKSAGKQRAGRPSYSPLTDLPIELESESDVPPPQKPSMNKTPAATKTSIRAKQRAVNAYATPSQKRPERADSEDSTLRSALARQASQNKVVMSSDDEAGKHSNSDISNYDPDKVAKPKKRYIEVSYNSPVQESANAANAADAADAEDNYVEPAPSPMRVDDANDPFNGIPLPTSKRDMSHVDKKLLSARAEGRNWHECARMYMRITKKQDISDNAVKTRHARIMARTSNFTADEDAAITRAKHQVEEAFEKCKWTSVAAVWFKISGRKVGSNVLRERWAAVTDMSDDVRNTGVGAMTQNLDGDVEEVDADDVAEAMAISDDGGDVEESGDDIEKEAPAAKKQKTGKSLAPVVGEAEIDDDMEAQLDKLAAAQEGEDL